MKNAKHIKTRLGVVAGAALVIATGAIVTQIALAQPEHSFLVGVINNTTTPTQGADHPDGQIEIECGLEAWRKIANSWHTQFIECFPSTATDPFDFTYKARLADDAEGNAVYHSGTVTISCTRGSDDPAAPNAISAEFTLTGSGTGITASNVICNYGQQSNESNDD